jgi:hypothetical protein
MATDATVVETHDTPDHDRLVPDPLVQKEFGVTAMSIWRWDRDSELIRLGWPPPIRIRSRKFRSRIALEKFKRVMARRAIEQRAPQQEMRAVKNSTGRFESSPDRREQKLTVRNVSDDGQHRGMSRSLRTTPNYGKG